MAFTIENTHIINILETNANNDVATCTVIQSHMDAGIILKIIGD